MKIEKVEVGPVYPFSDTTCFFCEELFQEDDRVRDGTFRVGGTLRDGICHDRCYGNWWLDSQAVGWKEGYPCNRHHCNGVILIKPAYNCSCHLSYAPCSACTAPREYCPICGWEVGDE